MQRWLRDVLARIRGFASHKEVRFTHKALRELATLDAGLDPEDCCEILEALRASDSAGRIRSVINGEWLYVFKPTVAGIRLYLKLVVRGHCIVISFHEEGDQDDN